VRYGFIIPKGDPRAVAELAREVEEAGWDGAFYWDGINVGEGWETYDPWVVMARRWRCAPRGFASGPCLRRLPVAVRGNSPGRR
jgi:hypothetical protein